MKLHYSQTRTSGDCLKELVLLPYEITLFSNQAPYLKWYKHVLLPYEITLFSNGTFGGVQVGIVLLPYEITLFSN